MLEFSLVFLLIYGPKLGFMGFDFVSAASLVALLLYRRHLSVAFKTAGIFWALVASIYVFIILIVNVVVDEWWLARMPRYILNLLACFALAYSMSSRGKLLDLLLYIFLASALHSSIVVSQVMSVDFHNFLTLTLGNFQNSEIRFSGLVRGLTPPSFVMAGSIGLGYYCYVNNRIGFSTFLFLTFLILFACLVMGRAGLYLGVAASGVAILYDQISKGHTVKVVFFVLSTIASFAILLLSIDLLPLDPIVVAALKYGLEPFVKLVESDRFSSISMVDFANHKFIFHNITFMEHLFGTGLYGRGDPVSYLPTDIAYAHMFSAFGMVGLVLFILGTFSMVGISRVTWKHARYLHLIALFMVLCVFIMNIKETVIMARQVTSLLAFLWGALYFTRRHAEY